MTGPRRETTDGHTGIDGRPGWDGQSLNNAGTNGGGGTTYHPPDHGGGGGAGFTGDGSATDNRGSCDPGNAFVNGGVVGPTTTQHLPCGEGQGLVDLAAVPVVAHGGAGARLLRWRLRQQQRLCRWWRLF